jgi:hypothetical protein
MKIISTKENHRGKDIRILNEKVKFDTKLEADVSDKLGKQIIKELPEVFYEKGKAPSKVEAKNSEELDKANKELEVEMKKKDEKIADLEAQLEEKEKGNANTEIAPEDMNIIYDVCMTEEQKLKETCESLKFPNKEWKKLDHKRLAFYVINKTMNKEENPGEEETTEEQPKE